MTVRRGGRTIDAVAQATKHGFLFVFDRATGEPLFPIEDRKFPPTTVPGDKASETQPVPTKPAPFARQLLTADLLTNRTPEARQWALEQFKSFRSEGQFVPLGLEKQTVVFPGFDGGAEWGGQAFDPDTGLYYINANDLAWTGGMAPNTAGQSGKPYTCSIAPLATATIAPERRRRSPRSSASPSGARSQTSSRSSGKARDECPGFHSLTPPPSTRSYSS